jgi:hypothetical protein
MSVFSFLDKNVQELLNVQECPGDSLFDPIILSCASPDTVSCLGKFNLNLANIDEFNFDLLVSTESSDPVTTESTPTSPPFICAKDGSFAVPGLCVADFFICIDGISYPQVSTLQLILSQMSHALTNCRPVRPEACSIPRCSYAKLLNRFLV